MCGSMVVRGVAWHAILHAALPEARLRRSDALQGTFIGVLMSATLPARLGEPSRALIVARRTGRPRENLPTVVGSIVSQTLLNVVALVGLGIVMFSTVDLFSQRQRGLVAFALAPMAVLVAVLVAARAAARRRALALAPRAGRRWPGSRAALAQVRAGLRVFRSPKLGAEATALQLGAWVIQWLSCYVLLVALGLDDRAGHRRRRGRALRGQRHRGAARSRRRTSASSSSPASRCWPAPTASARPTRWPTGSSCRPSRSRPPWSWARPRWSRRA